MTVPEGAQLSDDGNYWWDGSDWQPTGNAEGGAGLVDALTQQGIAIAPEAADATYIQQIAMHVNSWYEGLDENSRAIVDALSKLGGDALLGDPEVGVVTEGDPLISAFSANSMTLQESLQATNQALEQTA
ncbi:hypothetical protein [Actinophytocola glycyrrhizae]|uniref:Uncharacterized protein n=1 Tax=Actinophytocola glycyrrhizae TaxID=2044873 RepID=A0ABV9S9P0_9PSEU